MAVQTARPGSLPGQAGDRRNRRRCCDHLSQGSCDNNYYRYYELLDQNSIRTQCHVHVHAQCPRPDLGVNSADTMTHWHDNAWAPMAMVGYYFDSVE